MVTRLARYAQIARILTKYGFGIFLLELFPEDKRPEFLKHDEGVETMDIYRRIRMAIEELGPTFIKMGQIMSVRRDMLPLQMINELQKLTDSVKSVPFEEVRPLIEETCGALSELCLLVDEEPFAAASLSQAHRAVLKDGTEVVFKVQRPNIQELIEVDLTILESLAQRAEKRLPYMAPYNPVGLVEEFSHQMRKELDFVRDGKNAETIRENMKELPEVKVPKIYWEYSGPRLLVMEYVHGTRIDDVERLREKHDLKRLAEVGFEAYLKQIFVDGFFHGDPHPGNLLVTDDGKLVFLDFGMVGILRPERRLAYIRVLYSVVSSDVNMLLDSLEDLEVTVDPGDLDGFKDEMYAVMQETRRYQLGEFSFMDTMMGLTGILYRYRVRMPGTFMLMVKVVAMVTDVGVLLDPGFNFVERVKPYLNRMMVGGMLRPEHLEEATGAIANEIMGLPRAVKRFADALISGRSKMEVNVPEVTRIERALDRSSERLLLGMLASALIIGIGLVAPSSQGAVAQFREYLVPLGMVALLAIIVQSFRKPREDG
jgi:ubiquinone biosynthesis protein